MLQFFRLTCFVFFFPFFLPAQGLPWKPGDQWHYELLWTIDAPELRDKKTPPSSVLAYPVFTVLDAREDGFTLRVRCDSARVATGPTGRNGDGLLLQYQIEYIFRTDRAGRLAEITNLESIEAQMLRVLEKSSFSDDPPRMIKEFRKFPNWEEAFFLREYDFIFDAYGHVLKPGVETPVLAKGKRFYHLTNTAPMDIAFGDSIIGTPTVMQRTMMRTDSKEGIRIAARGAYEQPAYEYKMDDGAGIRYEPKKGYYRASGVYDSDTGRFLEGELIFGTTGGKGKFVFNSGNSMDMPEQRIEERRVFKPFTPKPAPDASPVVDLPGIALPVFPKFQEVVYHFYQNYKGSAEPYFKLTKHPDGYRITRLKDNSLPMFEPELIWSAQQGWQPVASFNKPEPAEPDDSDRLAAVYNPYEWKGTADWYLRRHTAEQAECDRQPFYGYPGYYNDIILLYEPRYKDLSNEQLHALARCYSFAAAGLLHNNTSSADSARMFQLPPGQNALNPQQLAQYKSAHKKAVDAYALLAQRDPDFPTPVGSARIKHANEIMDGVLTLRYYQNEQAARSVLQRDLYDAQLLQSVRNILESCPPDAVLVTYGDSDTYPLLYLQETAKVRTDVLVVNISLLVLPRYYQHILKGVSGAKPLKTLLPEAYFQKMHILDIREVEQKTTEQEWTSFFAALQQIKGEDSGLGYDLVSMPISSVQLPPAPASAAFPGASPEQATWSPGGSYVTMDALALMDVVAANAWSRPLCFSVTCSPDAYAPWQGHLALEGLVCRVFAGSLPALRWNEGAVSMDKSLEWWKKRFVVEAASSPLPQELISIHQSQMLAGMRLAKKLRDAARCQDALVVADILDRSFTDAGLTRNPLWIELVEVYAGCGQIRQAEKIGLQVWDNMLRQKISPDDPNARLRTAGELGRIGREYGVEKLVGLK